MEWIHGTSLIDSNLHALSYLICLTVGLNADSLKE